MSSPLVSVIIPNLGNDETLERAVTSAQTCEVPTEILVVENGEQCVAQGMQDVRVFRVEPQRPGHNRNVGLNHAHGDYVQFLDADDVLLGLQTRLALLKSGRPSVAVGSEERVDANGNTETLVHGHPGDSALESYLAHRWVPCIGCMLCERDVFREHRFSESLERAQDFHLWCRVFAKYNVTYTTEPVYRYYVDGGRAKQNLTARYNAQRKACQDLFRDYPEYRRAIGRRWARSTRHALVNAFQRWASE